MGQKVLVSLVSDQTIPNVEFIKEFQDEVDKYVFITTEFMESPKKARTECILKGANMLDGNEKRLIVKEDSIADINEKLSGLHEKDEFIVNLTGGTKMMSIAAYSFFKEKKSLIYYKPIRTNKIILVEDGSTYKEIETKISVNDYLYSYGVTSTSKKSFENRDITNRIYNKYINGSLNYEIIEQLRVNYRSKKNKYIISNIEGNSDDFKRIDNLANFLIELGFLEKDKTDSVITKSEIVFLTGGWFEELCFYYFKEKLSLSDDMIQLGVNLEKSDYVLNNDLDIVFVYNNNLYVIECKTAMSKNGNVSTSLFNETIYKASALRAKFGLTVKNCLLTLSSMVNKNIDYSDRADVMNISLFGRKYFDGKIKLDDLINKIKNDY